MALAPGSRIGPFEITSQIGVGGMGEVYRATDTNLKRAVAIKVLPDTFAFDSERLTRFQREAEILASLNHPNIAQVYGLEGVDGTKALVMELVEGPTLADRIAEGPIPADEALLLARQIAEALEAAHEQGIIHRDLKPANVKLTPDDRVKVLDFGLAKLLQSDTATASQPRAYSPTLTNSPTLTTPAMTMAGVILGTAAYMSPEQAKGRPADKRSDIWAFGCVLYEMLAGKRAFDGEDVSDTLAAVLRGEPDWTAIPADLPSAILMLIQHCLERDRRRRTGDIAAALFVLRDPTLGVRTPIAPATADHAPMLRRAARLLMGAAATVTLGILIGRNLRPAVPPLAVSRFAFTLPEGQRLTETGAQIIAISPDGSRIAYIANRRLYLRSMSELEARPIAGTEATTDEERLANPVFSPDGQSIAFFSMFGVSGRGAIKRVPVGGGTPVTIAQVASIFPGMSWGTTGIILVQRQQGIMRVSPDGGQPELLVSVTDGMATYPQMLPGGDAVLFAFAPGVTDPAGAPPDTWDTGKIVVQPLTSKARATIVDGGFAPTYAPTGHLLYVVGGTLFAVSFDPRRRERTGSPVPVIEGVARAVFQGARPGTSYYAVSESGAAIYLPGPTAASVPRFDLAYVARQGGIEPLNLRPAAYLFPRVSPDGKHIAVVAEDGKDAQIWIYDASGASAIRQLTFGGRNNRHLVWSGNSERVAFQSDREGDLGIYSQRADGSDAAERLTKAEQGTTHIPESWSRDGRTLLYSEFKGDDYTLWALSLPEKKSVRFGDVRSSLDPTSATFSPDGRWVAYLSSDGTKRTVFVEPFPPTGVKHAIGSGIWHPLWSPDGQELFYRGSGGRMQAVRVTTMPSVAIGNPEAVPAGGEFQTRGRVEREYDVTPDGRLLAVVAAGQGRRGLTAGGNVTAPQTANVQQINVILNWLEELKQRVPVK